MRRLGKQIVAAACAALLLAGCIKSGTPQSDAGLGAGDDWPSVNGDVAESGYSRLTQIDAENAGKLGLAWSLDLPGEVTLEATPLAVGGTLYFTGSYAAVYAVDASSGTVLWRFDPQTWKHNPQKMHFTFAANRGVAYRDGKIFSAAIDGRLFALDAKTGKQLWSVETTDPKGPQTITSAPRLIGDLVIIGQGGADFGARGYVTAYDQASGKQAWRFYVAPGSPEENKGDATQEMAAKTWSGEWWKTGTGGAPWNSITFDAEMGRVYVATGNAAPYDQQKRGAGDNLFTAAIVALDAKSGKYIWHYQINPADSWDYDSTQQMTLATLNLDGKPKKVLMQAPKNGFFYVIDRETGRPISAGKTTLMTWAKGFDVKTGKAIEEPGIRYESGQIDIWPGPIGGHNWQSMSYSPKLGLVYLPVGQIGERLLRGDGGPDAFNVMGLSTRPLVEKPGDGKASLVAWDPVAQRQVWKVQHDHLWNGGALVTAGNVVFQGTAEGRFNAYDARSGKELWHFDAGLGIVAAPMTYTFGGKQYVSILVGYGGTTAAFGDFMRVGWKYGQQPRRLLTFALDGQATLPPGTPPEMKVNAVDDPALVLNPADVKAGSELTVQCAACHGIGMKSPGSPGPDLRESALAMDLASLRKVLKEGVLLERGMPRFEGLTDDQIRQIHAFIRAQARSALAAQAKGGTGASVAK